MSSDLYFQLTCLESIEKNICMMYFICVITIATEKQKQATKRLERNLGTMTLPHPKKSRGKSTPSSDTISLIEVSVNSNSLSTGNLASSKLSNSMLNISDGGS
jgi:hypothetical protein